MAGSALVVPSPAAAMPEWAVNGGMATAGAAVASLVVRGKAIKEAPLPVIKEIEIIKEVEVEVEVPVEVMPENLSKLALVKLLIAEMPAWQKAVGVGVPSALVLGLILGARKWSHLEMAKLKEQNLTVEAKQLSTALVEVESKLSSIMDERDNLKKDFESWKVTMEQENTKNNALSQKKLDAAFAETKQVRLELEETKKKLENVGLTKKELEAATRMNAELQKQLGDVQEANMVELEQLHNELASVKAMSKSDLDKAAKAAKADLEKALAETEGLRAKLSAAVSESEGFKQKLESTQKDLLDATEKLERWKDVVAAEAEALTKEAEAKLAEAINERESLEAWRAEREAWEEQTKSNFLDMETELKETKAALEKAEAEESDTAELTEKLNETQAALDAAKAQADEAAANMEIVEVALAEAKSEYERVLQESERSSTSVGELEGKLETALADASKLREALATAEMAIEDSRATIAELSEASMNEESETLKQLKEQHTSQIWEMEQNMRALEETMQRTKEIASVNAERMMRHNERMGRVVKGAKGSAYDESDIPVKFEIVVETVPGQRVAMVGTWNDWDVEHAFPMRWTEGNLWTVTTPVHADDTYEYKYVIVDEGTGLTQWQAGNNRTLALQLSLHDDVVLVEVVDSWTPNPEAMPIMLHLLDGTVAEVGSTQLLRECVRELRTEQALLDGSANLLVLEEIAASLGGLALPGGGGSSADEGDASFGGAIGALEVTPGKNSIVRNNSITYVDGVATTHATPQALAEAAAAREAKISKKNGKKELMPAPAPAKPPPGESAIETADATETDQTTDTDTTVFSPDGDVTVMEVNEVEDLDIGKEAEAKGVEQETGPR